LPSPPPAAHDERQHRFEAVYAAHRGPILGYLLRRTDSADDAADVLAETFLTVWRRLEDVPAGPDARLWLYGVARRVLANHHRGERRRSALADRLRADLAVSYQPPGYTGELAPIAAAYRRLPAAEREVLALSVWEGLNHGQIAVVLDCSRNAVRIRLHRARRRFARELAGGQAQPAQARPAQARPAQAQPAPSQPAEPGIHVANGDLA
jgi:RNA polymerase sigma factor (sigma-70 family)